MTSGVVETGSSIKNNVYGAKMEFNRQTKFSIRISYKNIISYNIIDNNNKNEKSIIRSVLF